MNPLSTSMLLLASLLGSPALAADRLTCSEVADWLDAGDLSEDVILQRIARHLGPVQRNMVDCLGDRATPRVRAALIAQLEGVPFDPSDRSVYQVDVDAGTVAADMGSIVARHVTLTWVGDLPYVVVFDDDVFETPDWFYDLRDVWTLEMVGSLPTGSLLAADPLALGERAESLVGEDAAGARTRLRNAGFKRLLVVHRGRGADDPEALVITVKGEDLWSEDAPECTVVFSTQEGAPTPTATPAEPDEPADGPVDRQPAPRGRRPQLDRGWFGLGLGLVSGVTTSGGTLRIEGSSDFEAVFGPDGQFVSLPVGDAISGRGFVGGELLVSGRVSALRMEANIGVSELFRSPELRSDPNTTNLDATVGPELEFGAFFGGGYGRRPAMAYLGWYVGAQKWFTGEATVGPDSFSIDTVVPIAVITGPQVVVDLYADRFGEGSQGPPLAMSLALRGALIGGSPHVGLSLRGLWIATGR